MNLNRSLSTPWINRHSQIFKLLICFVISSSIFGYSTFVRAADNAPSREVTKADLPRIPHTPVADVVDTFQLARDFKLEIVAAEPLVSDPIDACFDEQGRMFVAEMHGYPFSQEPNRLNPAGGGKKDAGIIRMLEDTNGDGSMDKSTVFADLISWPTSVCCFNGGVFVMAPGNLYYFKDTIGDGKADVREVVLSGFGRGNVQAIANGLKWRLDNKIYLATATNPKELMHRDKPLFTLSGFDLRFDPKTEKFEKVTGGVQYGHSMDNWGTRFVCSNSNHIQQVLFPQEYITRNPFYTPSGLIRSIATDGASARVFRISPPEPWRIIRQKWRAEDKGYKLIINDQGGWEFLPLDPSKKAGVVPTEYPEGSFTSATGVTIYRGDAYPSEFHGNAFIGDVGSNLVHRKTMNTDKAIYTASRADEGVEFMRTTDNWSRPVNFVNAPDGSLYVLDMYRETVEHPHSIPVEIKKYLHLTSGSDRGRIFRLVSPNMKRRKPVDLGSFSKHQLVAQLASENAWNRETAQRLLWERQDTSVVPMLEQMLYSSRNPLGRLHALYTLDGLNALTPKHIRKSLTDKHPRVRSHAVKLSEQFIRQSDELLEPLLELCEDESEHVRFQLAFSLGEASSLGVSSDQQAIEGLARLASDARNDSTIMMALYTSVGKFAEKLAALLLADEDFVKQSRAAGVLSQLGLILGSNSDSAPAIRLLSSAISADRSLSIQQTVLTGLGQGLKRRGSSVAKLLTDSKLPANVRQQVASLFERAAAIAVDESLPTAERRVAVRLLAFADLETAIATLPELLQPQIAQPLQRAAVSSLADQASDEVAVTLLEAWRTFSPQVRRDVVDVLVSKPARINALLAAIESKTVRPSDIERDKKQVLMSHTNKKIRTHSTELFGGEVNSDRAKVVAEYQDVLELEGDAERGLAVFKKTCSVCHQVGDIGHNIAPNLASVKNKSHADLLLAILDPNREAQPNFNVYTVVTDQGQTFTGIIAAETANSVTIRRAESKEDVILRSNIEDLISTGVSLMPEGLEKDLSKQNFADVIEFIKTMKVQAPK